MKEYKVLKDGVAIHGVQFAKGETFKADKHSAIIAAFLRFKAIEEVKAEAKKPANGK